MARISRLVVPGLPHHVTQRGSRRQTTLFSNRDCAAYLNLIAEHQAESGVEFRAHCPMPNHVHLIAIPEEEDSLDVIATVAPMLQRVSNWREFLAAESALPVSSVYELIAVVGGQRATQIL